MGGSGGGSKSGGYGESSGSSKPTPMSLNFAPFILGSALGLPVRLNERGGLTYGEKGLLLGTGTGEGLGGNKNGGPGAGLFPTGTVDPNVFQSLGNLFANRGGNVISGGPLADAFGQQGLANAAGAMNMFNNSIMPATRQLVDNGFLDSTAAAARQLFSNEFLPAAAQQFGQLGLDPHDSDFGSAVARESGLLSARLANDAANRRAQGIPLGAEIAQGSALLPLNLGQDLFGFEQASRLANFAGSPEGQIFNMLGLLSGMDTQSMLGNRSNQRAFNFSAAGSGYGGGGVTGGPSGGPSTQMPASNGDQFPNIA